MRSDGYSTKAEHLILEYLCKNSDVAVSASDILKYLSSSGECVNISTVYRRLERLIQNKTVIKHSSDGQKSTYQFIAQNKNCLNHLHIQCTVCSKIIHLDCNESTDFTNHIKKDHGFFVDCSKTIIYGLCFECKNKNKS